MYCCRFSPSLTPSLYSPLYPPPLSPFIPPSLSPIFPPSSFSLLPSVSLFIHVNAVCVRACVCCRVTKIDDYEIVQIRLPRHIAADSVRHTHHAHALTHTYHCSVCTVIRMSIFLVHVSPLLTDCKTILPFLCQWKGILHGMYKHSYGHFLVQRK